MLDHKIKLYIKISFFITYIFKTDFFSKHQYFRHFDCTKNQIICMETYEQKNLF